MTQPRSVVPGDTIMITRRTLRRHHLFRPDPAIRQLYLYTLAICARQFGFLVHAVTLMSTYEHLIVTDTQGRYPEFLRRLHRLVSLGTKVLRKWEGPTWDPEQSSVVRLLTEQAVIEKLAYVMANPVKAGLVRHARDWPGITVLPQELGRRTWTLKRPSVYFDAKSDRPTRRSRSAAGPSLGPNASVDSRRIDGRRALSPFGTETRPSPSAGDRGKHSFRLLQSFARFGMRIETRSSGGVRDCVAWCSHPAPGACAGCTARSPKRRVRVQVETNSTDGSIGRGTAAF